PIQENVYHLSKEELEGRGVVVLPEHLGEAVDAFASDKVVCGALGGYISRNLIELKRREFEEYLSYTGRDWAESLPEITPWEIDRYLTRC
ncbi:MAG: glutamine synthetase, partial [Candidatus Bathyarchaeia archaeon]